MPPSTTDNRRHELRKAAILVSSLDPATADALLDQMPPDQAGLVRRAVMDLDTIDPREQQAVLDEFRRRKPPAAEDRGGVELDADLARRLSQSEEVAAAEPVVDQAAPFRFLHDAEFATLIPVLMREHPQTVAVVLSHLRPGQAAELLGQLPEPLQVDVIRRLADLDETSPEVVREIERGLESWFSEEIRSRRRRAAGKAAVQAILNAADGSTKDCIISVLARQDQPDSRGSIREPTPGFAEQTATIEKAKAADGTRSVPATLGERAEAELNKAELRQEDTPPEVERVFGFEDIERLNDRALAAVCSAAPPELVTLALAGSNARLVERICSRLAPSAAKKLRRALVHIGPTLLRDMERAQEELAKVAERLEAAGRIPPLPKRVRPAVLST